MYRYLMGTPPLIADPDAPPGVSVCEVCSSRDQKYLFSKDGYRFVECAQCRHVFVPFGGTDEELAKTYDRNFFSDGSYADYAADKPALQKNFERFIRILKKFQPHGRLFEVGCAYGFFLELARKEWEAEGADIQAEAVAHARERLGVSAIRGNFPELPLAGNHYDIVAMWDTIEHLRHPAAYIEQAARILKPGGILALTTGDVRSLAARAQGKSWRLYYPPNHLHYFSPETIRRLFERFGLRVEEIRYTGFYRSMEMMLYGLLHDRKPAWSRKIYGLLKRAGLAERSSVYVNLFDIMFVIARKDPE